MKKIDQHVLIYDNGLFPHIAQLCARYFTKVSYWSNWKRSFPCSDELLVGDGLDGVERVRDVEVVLPKSDLIIFPDLYHWDTQSALSNEGAAVFGNRKAEQLETQRDTCREMMEKWGMPVAPWWRVEGVEDLRKLLKEHDNVYVKGLMRGDFETFHHETMLTTEPLLDELAHKLGPKKRHEVFIVETPIEGDDDSPVVEVGFDGFSINGQFPEVAMVGYEIKDAGYLAAVMQYQDIAAPIRSVNEYLSPYLKKQGARGFLSSEVRVKDKVPHLIDPCLRCGSPCSEGYAEAYSNWGDILLQGALGTLVNPEPICEYVCELIIYSDWAKSNPLAIHVPDELKQWVKLHYVCGMDDALWCLPVHPGIQQVGAVVGIGSTVEEAVNMAVEISKEVKGVEVEFRYGSIDQALQEVRKGVEMGIPFGYGEVPEKIEI